MAEQDEIPIAFLDTLSCALGGVIVLFFVFASLTHEGARELKPPDEIDTARVVSVTPTSTEQSIEEKPARLFLADLGSCKVTEPGGVDKDYRVVTGDDGIGVLILVTGDQATVRTHCTGTEPVRIQAIRDVADARPCRLAPQSQLVYKDATWCPGQ